MDKGIVIIAVLTLVCLALQLLTIISVPLTHPLHGLFLSKFNHYAFGVFGVCDLTSGECSSPKIGYPSKGSAFYLLANDSDFGDDGVELPSQATYTISKLLIVHAVSFGISCIQFFLVMFVFLMQQFTEPEEAENGEASEPMMGSRSARKCPKLGKLPKSAWSSKGDLSPYLDGMLCLSLIGFLTTLLAFLADILLFINNLTWLGWIQLFPLIVLAFIATMICFLKRGISTRKYLEDGNTYENDDMKMKKKAVVNRLNDDASDDGFFVYTKGFFSTTGNNDTQDFDNGWVHHHYHHDDASIDSHDEHLRLHRLDSRDMPMHLSHDDIQLHTFDRRSRDSDVYSH